ncbi:large subunit GTPase 1 homolog [Orbicella faveolata]|uniref:large subunit GTPase 1 homolog n=1 Tax=Orbicella faveolata TaxID=48498 RepID=UPI0009E62B37|nr:large subunit GTPase 1 homolog [Orbicella faveolata]
MGKKSKPSLGKSIIRQRVKSSGNIKHANSWLHCSELDNDSAPNLQSITEQSALDDFLATAELAGTEFTAEKLNTTIVTPKYNEGLLTSETVMAIKQAQQEHQHFLRIPRRPEWDENMTAEELDQTEKESFLQWRRQLAQLQEKDHILLTPFERNLDFWRQLWRVIERSDVVVQIVDARNPLLFRCEDLENYVTDIDPKKCNLLLINKADLLSPEQRDSWARYFRSVGLPVAFWSAQQESERLLMATGNEESQKEKEEEEKMEREGREEELQGDGSLQNLTLWSKLAELAVENEVKGAEDSSVVGVEANSPIKSDLHMSDLSVTLSEDRIANVMCPSNSTNDVDCKHLPSNVQSYQSEQAVDVETDNQSITEKELPLIAHLDSTTDCGIINEVSLEKKAKELNSCLSVGTQLNSDTDSKHERLFDGLSANLLTRDELLALFKTLHREKQQNTADYSQKLLTTIGLVGYPNVGKSSTINTLLNDKKVPVSATPGRTKHFQTLYVNDEVLLCDCPGLVFPSFVSTKAEMILNGILPIDQMRDHVPAVSLLCQRIPRGVLEVVYGINIAPPQEGEDPTRAPYADELLSAYGYIRGFMTSHGIPDCSRSARYILKDYVRGKLLYCIAPPGQDETEFQQIGKLQNLADVERKDREARERAHKQMSDVDKNFFKQEQVRCFSRGFHTTESRQYGIVPPQEASALLYKPWKKHHNKNKREKLRRLVKN